jgi:ribosomal protein S18 acetylase RimI-like enzyme
MILEIEEIQVIDKDIEELSNLLKLVVDDGASIGFLPPMKLTEATKYWRNVLKLDVILFVARINNQLAGSVQLHLDTKENGRHRAEIGKLMTDPNFRRNGIGRSLMQKAEYRAKQENRSLIILDTREGDPSNNLYQSLNYIEAGKIPYYAKSANGELHTTVFYYKNI